VPETKKQTQYERILAGGPAKLAEIIERPIRVCLFCIHRGQKNGCLQDNCRAGVISFMNSEAPE